MWRRRRTTDLQPTPFSPDADYCVYCHAPAAGQCAACGALCCADCVELTAGVTTPRAVCRSCLQSGRGGGERWWFLRGALLCTAAILVLLGGLILLTR